MTNLTKLTINEDEIDGMLQMSEDELEYERMMMSAWEESKETGIPFDHIMGEILAGIH